MNKKPGDKTPRDPHINLIIIIKNLPVGTSQYIPTNPGVQSHKNGTEFPCAARKHIPSFQHGPCGPGEHASVCIHGMVKLRIFVFLYV